MEITENSKWARLRISNRYKYLEMAKSLTKSDAYGA